MTTLLHRIDSFWLTDLDYDIEDDIVVVDVAEKANAGPADSIKLRLPTNGYNATLLHRWNVETNAPVDMAHAVLLKPETVGGIYLIFGSAPTLNQFADLFFPF